VSTEDDHFTTVFDEVVFAVVAFIGGDTAVVCIVALLLASDKFLLYFLISL
jgi:hypothetical protein